MEASRLVCPSSSLLLRSSARSARRKVRFIHRRLSPHVMVLAAGSDGGAQPEEGSSGGGSVDEGMSTLWKRIGELKEEAEEKQRQRQRQERSGMELLPVELSRLELEEDSYTLYKSEMLEVLWLLQLRPEGERTKVDMGVTMTVKLLVPTSVLVVMLHLMDAAKVILNGMKQKSSSSS